MKNEQIAEMLRLQDQMNSAVNPAWRQAGYPFLRAVVVEGAEGMEHNGWKWWKRQVQDVSQLKLELVDILHFYLSDHMLSTTPTAEDMAAAIVKARSEETFTLDHFEVTYEDLDQVGRLEYMVGLAVVRRSNMRLLLDAWSECGASDDDLFRAYVGKNVLNIFRQSNGDKQGTYIKVWVDDREDNEHLTEIMEMIPGGSPDYAAAVLDALQARYAVTREAMRPG